MGCLFFCCIYSVNSSEKNGYTAVGEPCDDEGCPHIWMVKAL